MQVATSSCLVVHATPRVGSCLRAGKVGPKAPTVCEAGGLQRKCQLAAAALLSSAALQYTSPLDPAVCASVTAVRSPVEHTLAVKRELLEDLLMQEVNSRLKSMSDDDLVTVLEQLHQGRFQLPAAAPSLSTPQPSPDAPTSAVALLKSRNSSSDGPLARPLADRQTATDTPGLSFPLQDGQQTDKQAQPTVTSPTGKQGADQQDAAKSLPDAWQQQTFRLQAFTKPLMQRLQGAASPQVSPSGADSSLVAEQGGDSHLQSNVDQQSRQSSQSQSSQPQSIQPLSIQPQSSQQQSSQPQSSQPASAQQQSEDKEQQGATLAAGPAFRDQASAQESSAQSRRPLGQAVSSEELTSSEKEGLSSRGLVQSAEGSRGDDTGAEVGKASSSSDTSALVEQGASSDGELSGASGKAQNTDEAEDATTRMLESAGVPLPTSALNKSTVPGAVSQADRPSSVREYLGLVWRRTEPQLVLLVTASIVSTLAGTLAQLAAGRSDQLAAALLPSQHQHESRPPASDDTAKQVSGGQQQFAALRQAMWQGLLARVGRTKSPESTRQVKLGRANPAVGSSQVQAGNVPEISRDRLDHGNGLPSPVESVGNGQSHSRQQDEWGRPIVQLPMASGNGVHQHRVSNVGQSADQLPSKILWVRKDHEEHGSSDGTGLSNNQTDPQTVLWQREEAHDHAAEQADGAPRRFRRSRLGKHVVSIESLLDNVE